MKSDDDKYERNGFLWWLASMALLIIALCFSSCTTTKYIPVEKIVTKDSIVIQKEYDSIEIKVKEYVGGDTIYRDSIVFRYVLRCDTIYSHSRDSIPYPVEVVKEVERSLNKYEETMIRLGWCLIALVFSAIVWIVVKWYYK